MLIKGKGEIRRLTGHISEEILQLVNYKIVCRRPIILNSIEISSIQNLPTPRQGKKEVRSARAHYPTRDAAFRFLL